MRRASALLWLIVPRVVQAGDLDEPVEPYGFFDVYEDGESITIESTTQTSCTLSDAASWSTSVSINTVTDVGEHVIDLGTQGDAGLWTITCGGQAIQVYVGGEHRRLWLEHTPVESSSGLRTFVHNYDTVSASGNFSGQRNTDAGPPRVGASGVPMEWPYATAFNYLMKVAAPNYESESGVGLPKPDSSASAPSYIGAAPTSGLTSPSAWLTTPTNGELRSFRIVLERLTVLALLHDEYEAGIVSSGFTATDFLAAPTGGDRYVVALHHWGDTLAASGSWHTFGDPGEFDLGRSDLLIALAFAYDAAYPTLSLEQRRDWRKKLHDETSSFQEDYFICDPPWDRFGAKVAIPGSCPAPAAAKSGQPKAARRHLRNGHYFAHFAATSTVSRVLWNELETDGVTSSTHETYLADRDDWTDAADDVYADIAFAADDHGGDVAGVLYTLSDLDYAIRYYESLHLDPSTVGEPMLDSNLSTLYRFLLHATEPDPYAPTGTYAFPGLRSNLNDSDNDDQVNVSAIAAYLADITPAPPAPPPLPVVPPLDSPALAQRLAWQGHNPISFTLGNTRREAMDLLWWRTSIAPLSDTGHQGLASHACFDEVGMASLRTSWSQDATHLLYRGGMLVGGHDHPSVGGFSLFAHGGYLVTADGFESIAKRTANGSTLLLDGYGQHGDGLDFQIAPPETDPDARMNTYLDNSGPAASGKRFDVALVGSDLLPLYQVETAAGMRDSTLTLTSPGPFTNVSGVEGKTPLSVLQRYVLWVGGQAILVHDLFDTDAPQPDSYRVDWSISVNEYTDDDDDGVVEAADSDGRLDPFRCPVVESTANPGFYLYDGSSTKDVLYESGDIFDGPSSSAPTLRQEVNRGDFVARASATCDDSFITPSIPTTYATVAPAGSSKLDVRAFEGPNSFSYIPNTRDDGGTIQGYRLSRNQTAARGMFVTGLFPYAASASAVPWVSGSTVTGGKILETYPKYDHDASSYLATAWFRRPGSSTVSNGANNVMTGDIGAFARFDTSEFTDFHAVQLANGTYLKSSIRLGGTPTVLVSASNPVTIGLTYSSNVVRGWITGVDTVSGTTIEIDTGNFAASAVTGVWVNTTSVTPTVVDSRHIRFTVMAEGRIQIRSDGLYGPVWPRSWCGG